MESSVVYHVYPVYSWVDGSKVENAQRIMVKLLNHLNHIIFFSSTNGGPPADKPRGKTASGAAAASPAAEQGAAAAAGVESVDVGGWMAWKI